MRTSRVINGVIQFSLVLAISTYSTNLLAEGEDGAATDTSRTIASWSSIVEPNRSFDLGLPQGPKNFGLMVPNPYQCVSGQVAAGISAVGSAVQSGGAGGTSSLPGGCAPLTEPNRNLSCSEVKGGNLQSLRKKFQSNKEIKTAAACQENLLNGIIQEIGCLQDQGRALENQIQQLRQFYVGNIQAANQNLQEITLFEEDRNKQLEDATRILKGDGGRTSRMGLQEMEGIIDNLVTNQLPSGIAQFEGTSGSS